MHHACMERGTCVSTLDGDTTESIRGAFASVEFGRQRQRRQRVRSTRPFTTVLRMGLCASLCESINKLFPMKSLDRNSIISTLWFPLFVCRPPPLHPSPNSWHFVLSPTERTRPTRQYNRNNTNKTKMPKTDGSAARKSPLTLCVCVCNRTKWDK